MKKEKAKMYSEFLQISKQIGVPIKKVLDMFWYLSKGETIDNNKLVQLLGVSKNALNQVKKDLSVYLNHSSNGTALRKDAIKQVGALYDSSYLAEESLLRTLTESDVFDLSAKLLLDYKDKRTTPKRDYDQFTATVETTAKRATLLAFLGDVRAKRILFLGDDDFTSVATANIKSAQNIVVVDIDQRILDNIGTISDKLGLGIKKVKYDCKRPLPADLRGRFDTVFTDPPYTPEGISLFVSRAIEALDRKNQTARVYVCYGNSDGAKERFIPIQRVFADSGLMLRWVFDRFNRDTKAPNLSEAQARYILPRLHLKQDL